jgi:hypothetical protein
MGQDPQKTAIAAGIIGASSTVAGQYALIVLAALFGAFVALSRESKLGTINGASFIFRAVSISTFTAMLASTYLATKVDVPINTLLLPVAFLIAFVGDGWFKIRDWLVQKARK